jgi:hypothetical protein
MIGLASADDLGRSNAQTAVVPVIYLKPNLKPNFGTHGATIGTSTARQITSGGIPRDIQFGLKLKF